MKVQVINKSKNALPRYATKGDAGIDIRADFSQAEKIENSIMIYGKGVLKVAGPLQETTTLYLEPGARAIIPTGIYTAIPEGYEVQLRPRSGLAIKKGLNLINCVGTIDAGYRNEWGIPIVNQGFEPVEIKDGERIAQAVLNKFEQIEWEEVNELSESERGLGGFGSSGTK